MIMTTMQLVFVLSIAVGGALGVVPNPHQVIEQRCGSSRISLFVSIVQFDRDETEYAP
jgi:hypothetical protein